MPDVLLGQNNFPSGLVRPIALMSGSWLIERNLLHIHLFYSKLSSKTVFKQLWLRSIWFWGARIRNIWNKNRRTIFFFFCLHLDKIEMETSRPWRGPSLPTVFFQTFFRKFKFGEGIVSPIKDSEDYHRYEICTRRMPFLTDGEATD